MFSALRMIQTAGADAGPSMPSGALGIWYADDYEATPRPYLPNSAASASTPLNLLNGSRRALASTLYWQNTNQVTIVDGAGDATPEGMPSATLTGAAATWFRGRTINPLTAGTYTLAIYAKRNTGSDQTFKLYSPAGESGVLTATSSWQRFTLTFSHAGGSAGMGIITNADAAASLQVADFELYAGTSDLGPEPADVGHLFLDRAVTPAAHSYASGVLDMTGAGAFGMINFPSSIDPSDGLTVIAVAQKTAASSSFVGSLSSFQSFSSFMTALENNGIPDFRLGGSTMDKPGAQYTSNWNLTSKGWFTFGHRFDGTSERTMWFDQGVLQKGTNTPSIPTLQDLMFSSIIDESYGGGYKWAGLAMWDRSLTDQEMVDAQQVMLTRTAVTRGSVRFLLAAGDSISNGTTAYPYLFLSNDSPEVIGAIYSVVGGTLADVGLDLIGNVIPASKVAGSKYIVSLMVTNGLSDASVYLADLMEICDALLAQGALVVLGTLPPRASSGHNSLRNTVNTAIRTWVGTHCTAIFDIAADATVGTDAAGSDTGLYPDGVHPTDTVQSTYFEPIYRAAINAL